jgi:hypothetical protein
MEADTGRRDIVSEHAALLRLAHDDAARAAKGQLGRGAAADATPSLDLGRSEQPLAGRAIRLRLARKRLLSLAFLAARNESLDSSKTITVVFILAGFLQVGKGQQCACMRQ